MNDLKEQVATAFSHLLNDGRLRVEPYGGPTEGSQPPVLVTGRLLRLTFIEDRGDILVYAGSALEPDEKYPLQRVVHAVGAKGPEEGLIALVDAATLVENSLERLEVGLDQDQLAETKSRLEELWKFSERRWMDRIARQRG